MSTAELGSTSVVDAPTEDGTRWTLVATGDVYVASDAENPPLLQEFIGAELSDAIGNADLSLVNFEGAVRAHEAPIAKIGPPLAMHQGVPDMLRQAGFRVASFANNHAMDFGPSALARSLDSCHEAGILTSGAGASEAAALEPAELTVAGCLRVSVISLCEREFGVADADGPGTAWVGGRQAAAAVARARQKSDVVVVAAHGGVEHVPFSPTQRAAQLRSLVDAGADVVIGHHPHLAQGWDRYKGSLIFHSLGNLIFDSVGGRRERARCGALVRLQLVGRRVAGCEIVPLGVDVAGVTRTLSGDAFSDEMRHLERLSAVLASPEEADASWRELAVTLWHSKYRRLLEEGLGVGVSTSARVAMRPIVRSFRRWRYGVREEAVPHGAAHRLRLLMSLFRTESHRWAIETALDSIAGVERDDLAHRTRDLLWQAES